MPAPGDMPEILHIPYTYFPDPPGGTETYVAALTRGLRARGLSSAIAAPGPRDAEYVHDGVPVHRFETAPRLPLEELWGEGDPVAAAAFGRVLDRLSPAVVHLHGWTSGISLRLLRRAHTAGIPVVFTYHTPSVSCARGSLMIYGREVCDGALFVDRCSRCVLQQRGVPLPLGSALGLVPVAIGRAIGRTGLGGGPLTALRMTELMSERHSAFRKLMAEADQIVAVQDWVYELLVFLGAERAKLTLSRLALPQLEQPAPAPSLAEPRRDGAALSAAFFGRVDHTKGVHVIVEAMLQAPDLSARLDVFGAAQGKEGTKYLQRLRRLAGTDERVRFLPPLPAANVIPAMAAYDVIAVPSIWMETGPLVVPEAMSAGVPVVGSALGGVSRFVRDGVDGLLLPPGDVAAWSAALRRLVQDRELLPRLRAGVRPPETMWRIVDEMVGVYRRVLPAPA